MAREVTERGRLQRERILAQDEARRAADAANRAVFAEITNELFECFDLEAETAVSGDKTVGITFNLEQSRALLYTLNALVEGRSPWLEK